jgi:hypothetical protein
MLTKMDVRKLIEESKREYTDTSDKTKLVYAAILKGLYIALGGKKGIVIPSKLNSISTSSKIVFKYKIKLDTLKSIDKAYDSLYDSLIRETKINPRDIIKDGVAPITNAEQARLMTTLILNEYTEDIIINSNTVYSMALDVLNKFER